MMIPIWCPHCRTSLGDKAEAWEALRPKDRHSTHNAQGISSQDILEALGLRRMCCKKVMLTTNVLIHIINQYKRPQIHERVL
jgi:DNA-directed RNA polymerase subunit N (RpoN/RPB10)